VLYVHEVHEVRGRHEDDFEAAYRDGWLPMLAKEDDARLLWFCHHIHGTGPAYNVVTVTAVRDGAAWEQLARRLWRGDLQDWQTDVDAMRHRVTASVMIPVPWSPLQDVDFAAVPTTAQDHEPVVYMEDTTSSCASNRRTARAGARRPFSGSASSTTRSCSTCW